MERNYFCTLLCKLKVSEKPKSDDIYNCNERPSQATANPVGGKACSSTKGGLLCYIPNTYSIHKVSSLKFAYFQGNYPVTLLPPPRRLAPSLDLGTTWVRQPRSGSCHYPTAATKCNERPSQATANPVGGKACSSTKGGLLCYIPNTYSIHKVSSLKFAYFQGNYPVTQRLFFGIRSSVGILALPFRPLYSNISLLSFLLFLRDSHFS